MKRPEPKHPTIIYRPDLQTGPQRALFSTVTFIAWLVWLYLFLPVIGLIGWWIGIDAFRNFMLTPGGPDYLVTLTGYLIVIAFAAFIIFGWSRYNQRRYGGQNRRRPIPAVDEESIQQRFQVDKETLDRIYHGKIITLDVDEQGHIEHVDIRLSSEQGVPGKPRPGDAGDAAARPKTRDATG